MDHPQFLGAYEITLDSKNRVLIPLEFRQQIEAATHTQGKNFYVRMGPNRKLWMYTQNYYKFLLKQKAAMPGRTYDQNRRDFGMATLVDQDPQGRVLIPAKGFEWRFLAKEDLVLVGCDDHLEWFTKDEWYAEQERLIQLDTDEYAPVFGTPSVAPALSATPVAVPATGPVTGPTATAAEELPL